MEIDRLRQKLLSQIRKKRLLPLIPSGYHVILSGILKLHHLFRNDMSGARQGLMKRG